MMPAMPKWRRRGLIWLPPILAAIILVYRYAYGALAVSHAGTFFTGERVVLAPLTEKFVIGCVLYAILLLSVRGARKYKTRWMRVLATIVFPPLAVFGAFIIIGSVTLFSSSGEIAGTVNTRGNTYYLQYFGALQGLTEFIAEEIHRDPLVIHTRLITYTNTDSPRSWTYIIRPAQWTNTEFHYSLRLDPSGDWLVCTWENEANLAYQISTKTSYGHEEIPNLSPFLFIANGEPPNEADFDSMQMAFEPLPGYSWFYGDNGIPTFDAMVRALKTTNPVVRLATIRVLSCYWMESRRAGEILQDLIKSDPDPIIGKAAKAGLAVLSEVVSKKLPPRSSLFEPSISWDEFISRYRAQDKDFQNFQVRYWYEEGGQKALVWANLGRPDAELSGYIQALPPQFPSRNGFTDLVFDREKIIDWEYTLTQPPGNDPFRGFRFGFTNSSLSRDCVETWP